MRAAVDVVDRLLHVSAQQRATLVHRVQALRHHVGAGVAVAHGQDAGWVARDYLQGILYDDHGHPLTELVIDSGTGRSLRLDTKSIGHLFMIPDGSLVSANCVSEHHGAPGGIDIRYSSAFLVEDEQNSIIVYSSEQDPAIWLDALYVQFIIWAHTRHAGCSPSLSAS